MPQKVIFLKHAIGKSTKTGKDYNFLELSLNHRSFTVQSTLKEADTAKLQEEDKVEVVSILMPNFNQGADGVVVAIKPA